MQAELRQLKLDPAPELPSETMTEEIAPDGTQPVANEADGQEQPQSSE